MLFDEFPSTLPKFDHLLGRRRGQQAPPARADLASQIPLRRWVCTSFRAPSFAAYPGGGRAARKEPLRNVVALLGSVVRRRRGLGHSRIRRFGTPRFS